MTESAQAVSTDTAKAVPIVTVTVTDWAGAVLAAAVAEEVTPALVHSPAAVGSVGITAVAAAAGADERFPLPV